MSVLKKRYLRDQFNPMETEQKLFISLCRLNKRASQLVLDTIAEHLLNSTIPKIIQLSAVLRFVIVGCYCKRHEHKIGALNFLYDTLEDNANARGSLVSYVDKKKVYQRAISIKSLVFPA